MKKVSIVLLSVLAIVSFSSCSSNNVASSNVPAQNSNTVASSSSTVMQSSSVSSEVNSLVSSQAEQTKFEQFESGLNGLKLQYEKVTMGAELVGAEQGIKYKLSDGNVELYKFDKNSDAYKKASKNKALTLEGFGDISAEFNDNMALIFDDDVKEKSNIENIFKALK